MQYECACEDLARAGGAAEVGGRIDLKFNFI